MVTTLKYDLHTALRKVGRILFIRCPVHYTVLGTVRHIQSGKIMNTDDSQIMKQLVEQIIVGADSMEIQFKCGVIVKQKYVK